MTRSLDRGRSLVACRLLGIAAALACTLVLAAPGATVAREGRGAVAVVGWVDVTLKEISAHRTNPPRAARALALVSVAVRRASRRGAPRAHGAAAEVLGYLFPNRRGFFDRRAAKLARSAAALRRGRAVGAGVVARGRRDRSDRAYSGTRLFGVGYWREERGVPGPLEPAAGQWLSWNIPSGSVYRPPPPPPPGSLEYLSEVQRVYDASVNLTAHQRAIALYWADGAGTETPPGRWNRIAIELVKTGRLSAAKAARTFALLNTAQADAFIAAWDAKYSYWSERPVEAIRREIEPHWSPLIPTPPFPGYVSGHATTSGAASVILGALFPARSRKLANMARQAAISRLYAGIHFPIDNDAGLMLGRHVGRAALDRR